MRLQGRFFALAGVAAILLAACGGETKPAAEIKTDFGVVGKTIKLGELTPLTGPLAVIGKPLTKGHEVYWQFVNDQGGVGGYKVELITKDSLYKPDVHVQQYNAIVNDVLMIDQSLGTPTTQAIKDLAAKDKILVSAATLASSLAREKYLILIGAPYRLQVENAFEYVTKTLGKSNPKTFLIYQDDDYGIDGQKGYQESISAYGLNDVGQRSYKTGDRDFTAQVNEAKSKSAEYVFLVTTPTETGGIIGKAASLGYKPKWLLQSPGWSPALLKSLVKDILVADALTFVDTAEWGDTSKPGMKEMLDNMKKYAPEQEPDGFFLFGYTQAKITHAILKKAIERRDLTRDGMLKAKESLKNIDLGGLLPPLSYGTTTDQRVPDRASRAWKVDPAHPTGLAPITDFFTGTAAKASKF